MRVGHPKQLRWFEEQLKTACVINTQVLGPGPDQLNETNVLNRTVGWQGGNGITYEADIPIPTESSADPDAEFHEYQRSRSKLIELAHWHDETGFGYQNAKSSQLTSQFICRLTWSAALK